MRKIVNAWQQCYHATTYSAPLVGRERFSPAVISWNVSESDSLPNVFSIQSKVLSTDCNEKGSCEVKNTFLGDSHLLSRTSRLFQTPTLHKMFHYPKILIHHQPKYFKQRYLGSPDLDVDSPAAPPA